VDERHLIGGVPAVLIDMKGDLAQAPATADDAVILERLGRQPYNGFSIARRCYLD
jgi:hypothetical protein